jgi:hypothetical protein
MVNRREVVVSVLGLLAAPSYVLAQEETEASHTPWLDADFATGATAYVAPDGVGDGLSWASAAPIEAVGDLAGLVGAGGTILLLGDAGAFAVGKTINIAASGAVDAPVTIRGAGRDGRAMNAALHGTRQPWVEAKDASGGVDASGFGGNTLFNLGKDASHIRFAGLDVADFGCVLNMAGCTGTDIGVEAVHFTNIRDGIYTDGASAVSNVVIRDFSGRGFSKKAIRFHGQSSSWLIEDCQLDSAWQWGDNFAVGIEAHDTAHGLHIVGGSTRNCTDNRGGDAEAYWNGDGVASERGNYDLLIEGHETSGHTDSGFDFKSESTVLRNCVSTGCKRNYRLWGGIGAEPMQLTQCQSLDPLKRGGSGGAHHIWISGASEPGDVAGSLVWTGGKISGGAVEAAIHADGGNVAVHLVDVDLGTWRRSKTLFEATKKTSRLLIGSASDTGAAAILVAPKIELVEAAVTTVALKADAEVTWRVVDETGVAGDLEGDRLALKGDGAGSSGQIEVQARDSRGVAIRQVIATATIENPVAPGAVLALAFVEAGGKAGVTDATRMHSIRVSDEAEIVDGIFRFDGNRSYFEVDQPGNFIFDGAFAIEAELAVDRAKFDAPADLISFWKTAAHRRSFRLGVTAANEIAFYWSTNGRSQDDGMLVGPVLSPGKMHKVAVDRGEDGIIRLHVEGAVVAQTPAGVGAFHASNAPLRVSGRPDGKQTAVGRLAALTIIKGRSLCDGDQGCGGS